MTLSLYRLLDSYLDALSDGEAGAVAAAEALARLRGAIRPGSRWRIGGLSGWVCVLDAAAQVRFRPDGLDETLRYPVRDFLREAVSL